MNTPHLLQFIDFLLFLCLAFGGAASIPATGSVFRQPAQTGGGLLGQTTQPATGASNLFGDTISFFWF